MRPLLRLGFAPLLGLLAACAEPVGPSPGVPAPAAPDVPSLGRTADGVRLGGAGMSARLDAFGVEVGAGAVRWRFDFAGPPAEPEIRGARATADRGGVLEWYPARPEGIEQGFDVAAAPAGDLVLAGRVETPVGPEPIPGDLRFGELRYVDLRAFDAAGRRWRRRWSGTRRRARSRCASGRRIWPAPSGR
jgi:hypothetical protein